MGADGSQDVLAYEVDGGVALVTLDRPKARNALSKALLGALAAAMAQAGEDPDVAVVVVTGRDPAFCAGLDLYELGSTGVVDLAGSEHGPWAPIAKPVIGAVNGPAVTGGLELALSCDFLVASERAVFGDTHGRVGVMPAWGLSALLPRRIGLPRAIEMSMTGNFVGASEALRLGLVNHVVPHDELLPTALSLGRDIAGCDQQAVRTLLASYRRIEEETGVGTARRMETEVFRDWLQGVRPEAIAERRAGIMERGRTQ
jgi:enoyl-CoA hydratase